MLKVKIPIVFSAILLVSCSDNPIYDPWCPNDSNTILYFSPSIIQVSDSLNSVTEVRIKNSQRIVSIYFEINYNPELIGISDLKTYDLDGHIFSSLSDYTISDSTVVDSLGIIKIGVLGEQDGFSGVSNDGILARIFINKEKGFKYTSLDFNNILMYSDPVDNPPVEYESVSYYNALITGK